jgi:hypothetical protein
MATDVRKLIFEISVDNGSSMGRYEAQEIIDLLERRMGKISKILQDQKVVMSSTMIFDGEETL